MRDLQTILMSGAIKTIGKLSTGIANSFEHGFTSGQQMEYIYDNKAHGRFIIGKLIDRVFLNNVGWRGVRNRKDNLKKLITTIITNNRGKGVVTTIHDLASGSGRYLFEALSEVGEDKVLIKCQDINDASIKYGQQKAKTFGFKNIQFVKGNAFDQVINPEVSSRPNVIVAAGFYDWITDDELIKKSIAKAYAMLEKGGVFIFTNLAGHKQLDLVANAFVDFNQQPLIMKLRDPVLINKWAQNVGFKILDVIVDQWGFYSITLGSKE